MTAPPKRRAGVEAHSGAAAGAVRAETAVVRYEAVRRVFRRHSALNREAAW